MDCMKYVVVLEHESQNVYICPFFGGGVEDALVAYGFSLDAVSWMVTDTPVVSVLGVPEVDDA